LELATAESTLELTATELTAELTSELATKLTTELPALVLITQLILDLLLLVGQQQLGWSKGTGRDIPRQPLWAELGGHALTKGRHERRTQSEG